jgi:hypothetical protein
VTHNLQLDTLPVELNRPDLTAVHQRRLHLPRNPDQAGSQVDACDVSEIFISIAGLARTDGGDETRGPRVVAEPEQET